jgi:hypothetical protein
MRSGLIIIFALFLLGPSYSLQGQYVTLDGKQFKDGTADFYPIVANYSISVFETANGTKFIGPHIQYRNTSMPCSSSTCAEALILQDLNEIKTMGFNTIRLFGLRYGKLCTQKDPNGCIAWMDAAQRVYDAPWSFGLNSTSAIHPISNQSRTNYLVQVLDLCDQVGLKVIYLAEGNFTAWDASSTQGTPLVNYQADNDGYINYLNYVSSSTSVQNHQALLAYDLFNEPLYHFNDFIDPNTMVNYNEKGTYCSIVNDWIDAVSNDPNHLTTIGLITSDDVMNSFDPNMMNVDFVSIHEYPTKFKEKMHRNIVWASKFINKPWIIGETAFSAKSDPNNSSIDALNYAFGHGTLQEQKNYFESTFDLCLNCMGSGYSVWLHKDVNWFDDSNPDSYLNYYGLIDENGNGKPVASSLLSRASTSTIAGNLNNCQLSSSSYYDHPNLYQYSFSGYIYDEDNIPIEGALVNGLDGQSAGYNVLRKTFTDEDGFFEIKTTTQIQFLDYSAVKASYRWTSRSNFGSNVSGNTNGVTNNMLYQYPSDQNLTVSNISISAPRSYKAMNTIEFSDFTHAGDKGVAKAGTKIIFKSNTVIVPGVSVNETFEAYINTSYNNECPNFIDPNSDGLYKNIASNIIESTSEEVGSNDLISVFPNPFNDRVFLKKTSESESLEIQLFNSIGQELDRFILTDNTMEIEINGQAGLYILRVKDGADSNSIKILKR